MQNTTNYNLNKPDGNDFAKIQALNENADIIDGKLKELEDGSDATDERVATHLAQNTVSNMNTIRDVSLTGSQSLYFDGVSNIKGVMLTVILSDTQIESRGFVVKLDSGFLNQSVNTDENGVKTVNAYYSIDIKTQGGQSLGVCDIDGNVVKIEWSKNSLPTGTVNIVATAFAHGEVVL